jgi:hypothetical protein
MSKDAEALAKEVSDLHEIEILKERNAKRDQELALEKGRKGKHRRRHAGRQG